MLRPPGVYGVRIGPFARALRRVSNNALGGDAAAGRGGEDGCDFTSLS